MARDDEREAVLGAERARRARRAGPAGEGRELAVGDDLAPGDAPAARRASASWNGVAHSHSSSTSSKRDALAAEVRLHALGERMGACPAVAEPARGSSW